MLWRIFFMYCTFFVSAFPELWAQSRPELKTRWGFWGYGSIQTYDAIFHGFETLPGNIPKDSSAFKQIQGSGFSLGVMYEHPFHEQISLTLRTDFTADLGIFQQRFGVPWGYPDGSKWNGYIEYTLYNRLHTIGFTPTLNWKPFRRPFSWLNGLTLSVGARLNYLIRASVEQTERIIGQQFPGSVMERTTFADTAMPGTQNVQAALQAGISYDIPVALNEHDHLVISPEIVAQLGLTTLTTETNWKVNAIRAGLSVKFFSIPERELLPPATIRTAPTATLNAQVLVAAVDAEQQEKPVTLLKVEEFVRHEVLSLLPYIFFEPQSRVLARRYERLLPSEVQNFQEKRLFTASNSGAPDSYYSVLNILGKRLRTHSSATITLVGCQDVTIGTAPDTTLSRDRANAVKEYLHVVWNIHPARMRVVVRGLPERRSSAPDAPSRSDEHHRVEIQSSEPLLLNPVYIQDTAKFITPSILRFYLKSAAEVGITRWSFWAHQAGRYLYRQTQTNTSDSSILWNFDNTPTQIPRQPGILSYTFEVVDANDQYAQATGSLPVEILSVQKKRQKTGVDKELYRFRLVFTSADNAELSREQQRFLDEFVRPHLNDKTSIILNTSGDLLGAGQLNRSITEQRTDLIAKRLSAFSPKKIIRNPVEYIAQPYNTALPEARIFSRYVEIILENPVW